MKILIIDPISSINHIPYNKLLVKSLLSIPNIEIYGFFGKNYISNLNNLEINEFDNIPNLLYNYRNNLTSKYKIVNLVTLFIRNIYISYKICNTSFSHYIFSSFEIFSVLPYLILNGKNKYFVAHNNYKDLQNEFKRYLYNILQKDIKIIVLNTYVKDYFKQNDINNTIVHPHGFPSKFKKNTLSSKVVLDKYGLKKNKYVFLTGDYNINDLATLTEALLPNSNFKFFIKEKKDILSLLKSELFLTYKFLERFEYELLLNNSFFVVINYDNYNNFSTSNTFLECLINEIKVKTNNINLVNSFIKSGSEFVYYTNINDIFKVCHSVDIEYANFPDSELLNSFYNVEKI